MSADLAAIAPDPVRRRVMMGLTKISLVLKSHARQKASQQGLTPTQAQILTTLRRASEHGLTLTVIATELGVTLPTVSDAINTLVEKGLVRKNRSAADIRSLALKLTAKGRRLAERVSTWPDFLMETVDDLTVEEQEIFLRSLIKMIRGLQEKGMIPVARMCTNCSYFRPNAYDDPQRPHHCGFLDAQFGDRSLQIECPEHDVAPEQASQQNWNAFLINRQVVS